MARHKTLLQKLQESIIYRVQYILLLLLYCIIRLIPLKISAKIFGLITILISPLISANKVALNNIRRVMPEVNESERKRIVLGVWRNLGMIIGEFFHVTNLNEKSIKKYVSLNKESEANLEEIKKNKKGTIIFSAHYGNWEVGLQQFRLSGLNISSVYRPLNNQMVDKFTSNMRKVPMISKGTAGLKKMVKVLKSGGTVVMMLDQKMNKGIEVPFFGEDVMTAPAAANLALKYDFDLIPARTIRKNGKSKFELEVDKPLQIKRTDDLGRDAKTVMTQVNKIIESWIREYPEQWFWVHKRWK